MTNRSALMKLSEDAVLLLLKEVLDLPADITIVGLQTLPLEGALGVTLEGNSLPEGVHGVMVEYKKFSRPTDTQRGENNRQLLRRVFVRFYDAQDATRHLASVDERTALTPGGKIIDLDAALQRRGSIDASRRKG